MACIGEPKVVTLDIHSLTMGANPRLPSNLNIEPLRDSIEQEGLNQLIEAWTTPKGVPEVVRGHRRLLALLQLLETNESRFKELFPKGLPVKVYEGIDARQATLLKLDHAGQESLVSKHELLMSVKQLMKQGFAEAEISNRLMPLVQKLAPLAAAKRLEITNFDRQIAEAVKAGKHVEAAVARKARYERIAALYHGRMTHLRNVVRCPDIVEASLFFQADGSKPKGYEDIPDAQMPNVTTKEVTALWKAHSDDLAEVDEKGVQLYNSKVTGPRFNELWKATIQEHIDKAGKKEPRAKAMSANAMIEEIKSGTYDSKGLVLVTRKHAGETVDVDEIEAIDQAYAALDLLEQYDKKAYDKVIDLAAGIASKLQQKASAETGNTEKQG